MQPDETYVIPDIHGQSNIEVFKFVQIEQSRFEDFHLGADMKDEQSQKIVDTRVSKSGQYDDHGLSKEHDLEIWAHRHVIKIIRLEQQWFSRVRYVRQISHGISEARWDDENKYREDHHDASEYDEYSCNSRLSYHGDTFLLRLLSSPIRLDHVYD